MRNDKHDRLARYRQEHPAWLDQAILSLGADAVDHATHQQRFANALQGAYQLGAAGCPPPEAIDWRARNLQVEPVVPPYPDEDATMDNTDANQLSLEQLLDANREYSLTLWVKPGYAQANFREDGSSGWSIATEPSPSAALRRVLFEYHTRGQPPMPIHDPGAERMLEQSEHSLVDHPMQETAIPELQARMRQTAPAPIRRTAIIRRAVPGAAAPRRITPAAPAAPTTSAPKPRLVRRPR